jgi:hypothetical protein
MESFSKNSLNYSLTLKALVVLLYPVIQSFNGRNRIRLRTFSPPNRTEHVAFSGLLTVSDQKEWRFCRPFSITRYQ